MITMAGTVTITDSDITAEGFRFSSVATAGTAALDILLWAQKRISDELTAGGMTGPHIIYGIPHQSQADPEWREKRA